MTDLTDLKLMLALTSFVAKWLPYLWFIPLVLAIVADRCNPYSPMSTIAEDEYGRLVKPTKAQLFLFRITSYLFLISLVVVVLLTGWLEWYSRH